MANLKFSAGRNASWLDLKGLKECDGNLVFDRLYYQDVTDDMIGRAVQGDTSNKNAVLIAEIIRKVIKSKHANPVEVDYMRRELVNVGVTNGHHYVRAYLYLGMPAVPFELSGHERATNYLVRLYRVKKKPTNNTVEYTIRPELVGLL